jgi:predicted permease
MTGWGQDLRYTLRAFRRTPGFTVVLVATVALGIGANSAIFSVVNSIVFRPLPLRSANRLVRLRDTRRSPDGQVTHFNVSDRHFLEIKRMSRSFDVIAAQSIEPRTLLGGDTPERVNVVSTSEGTWDLFGVPPAIGRPFTPEEELQAQPVALISDELWKRHFSSDPRVLGQTLDLEDKPLSIVGVMPPGFRFPYDASVWMPTRVREDGGGNFAVFARRRSGVTLADARAELTTVAKAMRSDLPDTETGYGIEVADLRTSLQENRDRIAFSLLALVSLFLLIACSNAAILFLARSLAMRLELAIRFALGSSLGRQWRRILIESITLSLIGGGFGLLLSVWLDRFLRVLIPSNLTDQLGVAAGGVDGTVAIFGLAASLLFGVASACAPLFGASTFDGDAVLRSQPRAGQVRRDRHLFQALAAGEIALSLVLLVAAVRTIDNFRDLSRRPIGFDPTRVWTMRMSISPRISSGAARIRFLDNILAAASEVPGVEAAGVTTINPLGPGGMWESPVLVDGSSADPGSAYSVNVRFVTPDLFRAMGIPIIAGRPFTSQDSMDGQPVAIISRRLAGHFWPRSSAVGKQIRRDGLGEPRRTIVGVAEDVGDEGDLVETWYLPYTQAVSVPGSENVHLMLRSLQKGDAFTRTVVTAIARADPNVPVYDIARMDGVRSDALAQERLGAISVALFASLGLLLAELGTFGIVSYAISRRTREFAIRLALGATPAALRLSVFRDGLTTAIVGIAVGLLAVSATRPLLSQLLRDTGRTPAIQFIAIAVLLLTATLLACIMPACRAATSDPMVALREE